MSMSSNDSKNTNEKLVSDLYNHVNQHLANLLREMDTKIKSLKMSDLSLQLLVQINEDEIKKTIEGNRSVPVLQRKPWWEVIRPPLRERFVDIDKVMALRNGGRNLIAGGDSIPNQESELKEYKAYQAVTNRTDEIIAQYKQLFPIWQILAAEDKTPANKLAEITPLFNEWKKNNKIDTSSSLFRTTTPELQLARTIESMLASIVSAPRPSQTQ